MNLDNVEKAKLKQLLRPEIKRLEDLTNGWVGSPTPEQQAEARRELEQLREINSKLS